MFQRARLLTLLFAAVVFGRALRLVVGFVVLVVVRLVGIDLGGAC